MLPYFRSDLVQYYLDNTKTQRAEDRCLLYQKMLSAILQAAVQLQALHDRYILHRDVKLENILIKPDTTLPLRAMLCDFGFSVAATADNVDACHDGMSVGTSEALDPDLQLASRRGASCYYSRASDAFAVAKTTDRTLKAFARYLKQQSIDIDTVEALIRAGTEDRRTTRLTVPSIIAMLLYHVWELGPKNQSLHELLQAYAIEQTVAEVMLTHRLVMQHRLLIPLFNELKNKGVLGNAFNESQIDQVIVMITQLQVNQGNNNLRVTTRLANEASEHYSSLVETLRELTHATDVNSATVEQKCRAVI